MKANQINIKGMKKYVVIALLFLTVKGFSQGVNGVGAATTAATNIANMNAGRVNVLDYSAKANGTDDQPELQAAFTAGINGTIVFPAGRTFYISDPIVIGSNTKIEGNGSTIKARSDFKTKWGGLLTFTHGTQNVLIENLRLDGNKSVQTVHSQIVCGIDANDDAYLDVFASNVTLRNCEILNTTGFAVQISYSKNWLLDNVYIHKAGDTIHSSGIFANNVKGFKLTNSRIDSCFEHGIYYANGAEVNITNNLIRYNGVIGAATEGIGISMRCDSNAVISGNYLQYNAGAGLSIGTTRSFAHYPIRDVVVSNNVINHNYGGSSTGRQVLIWLANNVLFSNNIVGPYLGAYANPIGVYLYGRNKNVSIANNNFRIHVPINVSGDTTNNIFIKSNNFYNPDGALIYAGVHLKATGPGESVIISENNGDSITTGVLIDAAYNLENTVVRNNSFTNTVTDLTNGSSHIQKYYFESTVLNSNLPSFTLTSTGDGSGVAKLTMYVTSQTVVTLSGDARFYTDAGGTANESTTWTITPAGDRTIYLKLSSGSSTMSFSKNEITRWKDWEATTNAPSIAGDITKLKWLQYLYVIGLNTLSGSIAEMTQLTTLRVGGTNTLTGDISNLILLTYLRVEGSNTLSGNIVNMTELQYEYVTGSNTMTFTNVTNLTHLCYLNVHTSVTLTSGVVNQLLADMWLNKDASKPLSDRVINLAGNASSGAPTGQGITDKANLAAYSSPTPPGTAAVWTVTTR